MGEEKHGKEREASFIDQDVERWLREEAPGDGLCLKRFHADYIVEGLGRYRIGDVYNIEETRFEITSVGKRCFPECALLKRTGRKCPLAEGVAFGKREFPEEDVKI